MRAPPYDLAPPPLVGALDPDRSGSTFAALVALVMALAAVVVFARMEALGPLTEHEALVVETAREMTQRGEWIVPHFGGEPRLRKSPLSYWLVAGSAAIRGSWDARAARLPSALAGLGTVAAVLWLGARMFGRRTGLVIGLVTASSVGVFWFSHEATAEMQLTFWCTLALALAWCGIESPSPTRRLWWLTAAYAAVAVAFYAKAPVPAVVIAGPLVLHPLVLRGPGPLRGLPWKRAVGRALGGSLKEIYGAARHVHLLRGILLVGVVFGFWAWSAYLLVPNAADVWRAETIGRVTGSLREFEVRPLYYYLPVALAFALPWSLSVFEGVASPFLARYRLQRSALFYVWIWFVLGFVFFSLQAYKRAHYVLPFHPPLCILTGVVVDRLFFGSPGPSLRRAMTAVCSLVVALIVLTSIGFFVVEHRLGAIRPAFGVGCALAIGGAALAGIFFLFDRRTLSLATIAVLAVLVFFIPVPALARAERDDPTVKPLAAAIREHVPPDAPVCWLPRPDARVLLASGRAIPRFESFVSAKLTPKQRRIAQENPAELAWYVDARFRSDAPIYVILNGGWFEYLRHTCKTPARVLATIDDPADPTRRDPGTAGEDAPIPARSMVIVTNVPATPTTRLAGSPTP